MKKNNYIKKKILVFSALISYKDYVIFYPQHQDDEVLWAGSAIRYAIRARGADPQFICISRKYFLFVVLFQIIFILVLYN